MGAIFSSSFCMFYMGECFCTLPGLIKMFLKKRLSMDSAGHIGKRRLFAFQPHHKDFQDFSRRQKVFPVSKNSILFYKNKTDFHCA